MPPTTAIADRPFADWRLALKSILAFWGVYALTVVARAFLGSDPATALLNKALTIAIGMVLTLLIYAAINLIGSSGSWRRRAFVALFASLAASIVLATVHITADRYMEKPQEELRIVSAEGYNVKESGRTITIDRPGKDAVVVTFPRIGKLDPYMQFRIAADMAVVWFFFFAAWSAFYLALVAQGRAHQLRHRAAAAESAAQAAQVRALRYQVNPHFLFNTLNSLSSLVMTGRTDKAEEMLLALSTFFRNSLSLDPSADVTLAEEIDLQRLYLDIEKVRFPTRLKVEINVPESLAGARVPALILQPLVENAVKYGVSRTKENITLTITAEQIGEKRISVRVANSGSKAARAAPPRADDHGTGVGLANVCQRLDARFAGQATCDFGDRADGGYEVHLTFPLVR
jgi:two-component system LytT family sensor kinase